MKAKYFIFLSIVFLFGCKSDKELKFSDFVEVDKIDKVKIVNDSVSFTLTEEQLVAFRKDISSLRYAPDSPEDSFVDSSLRLRITIEGADHEVFSNQNSEYFKISKGLVTKNTANFGINIFEKGQLDLGEYKPEEKFKLYAISGLGVDSRVFNELELDCELIPLEWIDPRGNESIESYALRLSKTIDQTEEFGVLGVSFGGLVATEISKKLNPKLTVLISTAETKEGVTSLLKLIGKFNLNDYLSTDMFDPPRRLSYFMFGTDDKEKLDAILDDSDLVFTKWAVEELVNWKNETKLKTVIHISGTDDRIFPPTESKNLHLIEGGGHFMIIDKAPEVSEVINDFILKNQR
jgi:hypothetical protein